MILDQFKLDGKVALVTGAGRGLGQGYALALAEAGADVALLDRTGCAETAAQVEALGSDQWSLSDLMMVEEFVPGRELTVAVMGDRPLGVTEIVTDLAFYDYEAKYAAGGSRHILPARIPAAVTEQAMALSVKAHQALGCRGVTRTDLRYDDTGATPRLILLETNTQPGMTPTSLVPEQAAHIGMSYAKLCRWIVEDASCDR